VSAEWSVVKCIKVVSALEDLAGIGRAREHVKALLRVVDEICGDYYLEYPQLMDTVSRLRAGLES
jgi:hypothetical protein